jgi:hypothetical protein
MSGLETIAKYGCLSDENRWNTNRYDFPWLHELDEHDREIIKLLDCLRDDEYSGQASTTQFYDMLINARKNGYPEELAADWSPLFSYMYTIVYEEMRHGMVLGLLYHYVTTEKTDYLQQVDIRNFGKQYIWCYEERRYWDKYSYILTHLFSEVINTELYRDVVNRVYHPELREILANIRNDEARHIAAWTALIKDMINADPRHKEASLQSLERGLLYHNAMVHETYFEGLNKMLPLFLSAQNDKLDPLRRITHQKYRILVELFGEQNPYSEKEVQDMHISYLHTASGQSRAKYSESSPNNIEFVA